MSQGLVERQNLEDIADAIRSKNGSSDTYTPAEMAQAISGIHTADEVVLVQKTVNANGQYNASDDSADGYSGVRVNVPNSYSASDEGKVVSNGDLVAQTSKNINANGTHDTTANNSVVVDVPNSYAAADEGKVVSGGALVGQTSRNVTVNGTYDTTTNNEVIVNVSGGGDSEGGYLQRKLLNFDFTKSLTDTVRNYTPKIANVTQDSQGAHFNSTSAYLKLPKDVSVNEITIEVDVVEMNMTSGTHRRFIIGDADGCGLIYRSNGKWAFYSYSWVETTETDPHFFDGKTIKIHIDNQGYWHIYVNGVIWFEPTISLDLNNTSTSKYLVIGSTTNWTIYDSIISGLRIYHDIYADLAPKTITQNGTYNPADDNADGYSSVTVNVSGGDDSFSLTDYIESSGTQWIDTEYVPTQNSVYELVAEFLSGQPTYSMIIGARSAREGTGGNPVIFGPGSSAFQLGWGTITLTTGISSTPFLNQKVKYIIDKDGYNGNNELNRPCGYGAYNGKDPLTGYNIYLFSLNANGSEYGSGTRCKAKLYRFRIYESGTLVHEYIPHIDSQDVVCLKDTQTGNLFYNAGTGVFTYGTDGE